MPAFVRIKTALKFGAMTLLFVLIQYAPVASEEIKSRSSDGVKYIDSITTSRQRPSNSFYMTEANDEVCAKFLESINLPFPLPPSTLNTLANLFHSNLAEPLISDLGPAFPRWSSSKFSYTVTENNERYYMYYFLTSMGVSLTVAGAEYRMLEVHENKKDTIILIADDVLIRKIWSYLGTKNLLVYPFMAFENNYVAAFDVTFKSMPIGHVFLFSDLTNPLCSIDVKGAQ